MCAWIESRASALFSSSPVYYGEEARGLSSRSAWSQTWPLKISVAHGGCSDLGRVSRNIWMLWLLHSTVPCGLTVHSIHCCRQDVLLLCVRTPKGIAIPSLKVGYFFKVLHCWIQRAVIANLVLVNSFVFS